MRTSANSVELAMIGSNRLVRLFGDWQRGESALHDELTERIRSLVRSGVLPSGARLPSERSLSGALGLSRNTVTKALDSLRGEGLLASRQGDGTYVTFQDRANGGRGDDRLSSFIGNKGPVRIDLRSAALPGLALVAEQLNLIDGARTRELVASHGYFPAGLPELRDAIAEYYVKLGLPTGPEHIVVTSGAQQALGLVASCLVPRGAPVIVEEPTFRGVIELLRRVGARLVSVPSGPDGIDVNEFARTVAATAPVLAVLQSTVHNPTGSVLDGFRRSRVAAIAKLHDVRIIDDATLADTIIDGERRPLPLAAGDERIMTVGSVSKSFWGGLRLGWLRAHPELVAELVAVKGGEDLGTSVLAQLVATQLLPKIDRARDERLKTLREHRDHALAVVGQVAPEWTPQIPRGGGSLWIKLPSHVATALAQRAERRGVQVLPGSTFSADDRLDDHVRISYALSPELTQSGIELLASTWRDLDSKTPRVQHSVTR